MAPILYFGGSTLLSPFSDAIGLPVDIANFIFTNIVAISVGQIERKLVSKESINKRLRMAIEIVTGLLMCYFCFGTQMLTLLLQSTVALCIMKVVPAAQASIMVGVWSMGVLILSHAYRQVYDYGGYTLDVTGPLMILTQKLTSLACSVNDGERMSSGKIVKDILQRHAVLKFPSLLEFYAYCFYCHGIMCGPFLFYNEYINYINCYGLNFMPSARKQIGITLSLTAIHGLLTAYIAPTFSYTWILTPEFQKLHMTRKLIYTTVSFFLVRQKYYTAWGITESAGISAGLGFSGFDKDGEAQWEAIKNSDLLKIEGGNSLKVITDGWNLKTALWLREVIYERSPVSCRVFLSFLCSAVWHGLYPGYYLMFLTAALFTVTGRIIRRNVRPLFQQSPVSAKSYDILTTVIANMAMNYCQGPFLFLALQQGLLFWKSFYFFPHSCALFVIICSYIRDRHETMTLAASTKRY